MAAWLMLAAGDNREHAGNDGYDDLPSEHYSWDSTVPNCAKPQVGDVIVLRDTEHLLGASVIGAIETGAATKQRWRCPSCNHASIKRRRKKLPPYVCQNKNCKGTFVEPIAETISVRTYRSKHDVAWVDMHALLTAKEVNKMCVKEKSQNSIRVLDLDRFHLAMTAGGVLPATPIEAAMASVMGGHRQAFVLARIGQAAFRKRLLQEFGDVCAFTGPAPRDVLEGAHLYSYAADGRHHDNGGLMMRRDIHRLFDLGHIAVNPDSMLIDVRSEIRRYPDYAALHGQQVRVSQGKLRPQHRSWLRKHWDTYRGPST
ncbi:HNH endonuclease [Actinokineospora guangxiensis]|uniref:HNH endonuclease n=1 Tax=Actinokineospora guangxiensis TaxID=1490288 RepID=A0ABW0EXR0_9PSEU